MGLPRIEDRVFIGCVVAECARSENTTFLGPLLQFSDFVSNPGLMLSMLEPKFFQNNSVHFNRKQKQKHPYLHKTSEPRYSKKATLRLINEYRATRTMQIRRDKLFCAQNSPPMMRRAILCDRLFVGLRAASRWKCFYPVIFPAGVFTFLHFCLHCTSAAFTRCPTTEPGQQQSRVSIRIESTTESSQRSRVNTPPSQYSRVAE